MAIDKILLDEPHIVFNAVDSTAAWGDITGRLEDQADLKAALDAKMDVVQLAAVATSGEYADLKNKPYIPENTSDLVNDSGFITAASVPVLSNDIPVMDGAGNAGSSKEVSRANHRHPSDDKKANVSDLQITNQNVTNLTTSLNNYKTDNDTRVEEAENNIAANKSDITALGGRISTVENNKADKSSLAAVATSGEYADLKNKPDLSIYAESANLAAVATSGSHNDLTDRPDVYTKTETNNLLSNKVDKVSGKGLSDENYTAAEKTKLDGIESGAEANVQSDWNQTESLQDDYILNKPDLSIYAKDIDLKPVAKSGSYTDLTDKPILGTIAAENKNDYVTVTNLNTALGGKVSSIQPGSNISVDSSDVTQPAISVTGVVTKVRPGTNVTITGTDKEPVVSVTGIEFPEKFTATDSITGVIGDSVTSLSYANVTEIITGSTFKVNDVVIFSNGVQGQVIVYDDQGGTYDIVIVQIPEQTAWGGIGGSLPNQTDLKAALDLKTNDADLKPVAKTGSYNNLTDKPTIPTVPTVVSAFTNDAGYITASDVDLSEYTKTEDLADVALSGSYNSLTNKPTIPTVPTDVSAFANDSGYLVSSDLTPFAKTEDLSDVATSGSYSDLTDKPDVYTKTEVNTSLAGKVDKVAGKGLSTNDFDNASKTKLDGIESGAEVNVQSDWNQTDTASDDFIKNKPTLAVVATSGRYPDLMGKPDLTVYAKSADLKTVASSGSYTDLTDKPAIPENTSDLTNDSGYLNTSSVNTLITSALVNYDTSDQVNTKISDAINGISIPNLQQVVTSGVTLSESSRNDLNAQLNSSVAGGAITSLNAAIMRHFVTLSTSQTMAISGTLIADMTVFINNTGASEITITLPSVITGLDNLYSFDGGTVVIPAGKFAEVSYLVGKEANACVVMSRVQS